MNESAQSILVVEDNPDQAALIGAWLRAECHDMTVVSDGEHAVSELMRRRYAVIVTDIGLPGIDGLELSRRARALDPDVLILMITAADDIDYAVEALRGPVSEFVRKPCRKADFITRLERLLLQARRSAPGRSGRRVLAIGAHPDDVEIGCGGRLAQHVLEGDEVTILTLTGGAAGGEVGDRQRESRAAASLLNAELFEGGLPDTALSSGAETISVIERIIRQVQPDVVYTHSSHDTHQDHRAAHEASMVAARRVGSVLCYQAPSATTGFTPAHFVDVESTLSAKLAAIRCYASQVRKCDYLDEELLTATARYWARFTNVRYAEAFEVVRSSTALARAARASHRGFAAVSSRSVLEPARDYCSTALGDIADHVIPG